MHYKSSFIYLFEDLKFHYVFHSGKVNYFHVIVKYHIHIMVLFKDCRYFQNAYTIQNFRGKAAHKFPVYHHLLW